MSTAIDFQVEWLEERFSFDTKARNKIIEQACITHFKDKERLNILDIGAGTGSNFQHLWNRFPQHQNWIFVELNPELAQVAKEKCIQLAKKQGFSIAEENKRLVFQKEKQYRSIQILNQSFLELHQFLDLDKVDLITAGAVFDLLSSTMLDQFLNQLLEHQIALLATINYTGMHFQHSSTTDQQFIQLYEAHMCRQQDFGRAIGPKFPEYLKAFSNAKSIPLLMGSSHWIIGPTDHKMHRFLLDYMEKGIGETLTDTKQKLSFQNWLTSKRNTLQQGQLELQVSHQDAFWALGPK